MKTLRLHIEQLEQPINIGGDLSWSICKGDDWD